MARLVITGAGGFLGRNLIRGLADKNFFDDVIALTHGVDQLRECIGKADNVYIYRSDAFKTGEIQLGEEDIILNCAYPRATKGAAVTSGLDYIEAVFRAAADNNVKGIVSISSQSVYDPQRDHPALETDVPVLTDEYAIGKYCMEMLLRNICKDLPFTSIRLASLIGPGFDARVPNKMVKYALETGKITVQDNKQRFGYLDVEDAVRGLLAVLSLKPSNWKPIYNLGSKSTYTLIEIAESIADSVEQYTETQIAVNIVKGDAELNSAINNFLLISDIGEYEFCSLKKSIEKIISQLTLSKKNWRRTCNGYLGNRKKLSDVKE